MRHTAEIADLNTSNLEWTGAFEVESPTRHAIDALVDRNKVASVRWCRVSIEDVTCLWDVGALEIH